MSMEISKVSMLLVMLATSLLSSCAVSSDSKTDKCTFVSGKIVDVTGDNGIQHAKVVLIKLESGFLSVGKFESVCSTTSDDRGFF